MYDAYVSRDHTDLAILRDLVATDKDTDEMASCMCGSLLCHHPPAVLWPTLTQKN